MRGHDARYDGKAKPGMITATRQIAAGKGAA